MLSFFALLNSMGISGMFAARAFVPLFVLAIVFRVGLELGAGQGLLSVAEHLPGWILHTLGLVVMGILALIEWASQHGREMRALIQIADVYYKPAAAGLTALALVAGAGKKLGAMDLGGVEVYAADFLPTVAVLLAAGSTFALASARAQVLSIFDEQDEDDDLGVQGALTWVEDLWSVLVPVLFVLFPLVVFVLVLLVSATLMIVRSALLAREERTKRPCACGHPNYRTALCCAACGVDTPEPARVGLLGRATDEPVTDPLAQRCALFAQRRCPRCASRLPSREPVQACTGCGVRTDLDPRFLSTYDQWLGGRTPRALLVTTLLSLVPVVGAVPAIVYGRWTLIAPYRRYVSRSQSFVLRWVLRLLWVGVTFLQLVPLLGAVGIPLLTLTSSRAYRAAFRRRAGALGPSVVGSSAVAPGGR